LHVCGWLAIVALAGCGGSGRPSLVKVTGTVTLNGQPLEGALVSFLKETDANDKFKRPASGTTDAQGKFSLGTYNKEDGLPVGKYKIAVVKRELVGQLPENYSDDSADSFDLKYQWIVPRNYANPQNSGLTAEVTRSGLNPAVLELKRDGQPEIEETGPRAAARARANEP
jgi:hypothetical protein